VLTVALATSQQANIFANPSNQPPDKHQPDLRHGSRLHQSLMNCKTKQKKQVGPDDRSSTYTDIPSPSDAVPILISWPNNKACIEEYDGAIEKGTRSNSGGHTDTVKFLLTNTRVLLRTMSLEELVSMDTPTPSSCYYRMDARVSLAACDNCAIGIASFGGTPMLSNSCCRTVG
jgi:hypothetical protein